MIVQIKQGEEGLILDLPRTVVEELKLSAGDPLRIFLSFNGEKVSIVYEKTS